MNNMMKFLARLPLGARATGILAAGTGSMVGSILLSSFWSYATPIGVALFCVAFMVAAWMVVSELVMPNDRKVLEGVQREMARLPDVELNATDRENLDELASKMVRGLEDYRQQLKRDPEQKGNLYTKPFFLLAGPTGSGKTTLLEKSMLRFRDFDRDRWIEGERTQVAGTGGTFLMDWWFGESAVFLDTAGGILTTDTTSWQAFLKMLKRVRPAYPINGLVLCLDGETIRTQTDKEFKTVTDEVARGVQKIREELGVRFPVYLVLTKCDRIPGFDLVFESPEIDRWNEQMVGWSDPTPIKKSDERPKERFKPAQLVEKLHSLCTTINERRLHILLTESAKDGVKRADSVDELFSLSAAIEQKIIPRLTTFIERVLPAQPGGPLPVFFRGVYLTTARSEGVAIDEEVLRGLGGNMDRLEAKLRELGADATKRESGLFISDLLGKKVVKEAGLVATTEKVGTEHFKHSALVYGIGAAAALLGIGFTTWGALSLQKKIGTHAQTMGDVVKHSEDLGEILEVNEKKLDLDAKFNDGGESDLGTHRVDLALDVYRLGKADIQASMFIGGGDIVRKQREHGAKAVLRKLVVVPLVERTAKRLRKETEWGDPACNALRCLIEMKGQLDASESGEAADKAKRANATDSQEAEETKEWSAEPLFAYLFLDHKDAATAGKRAKPRSIRDEIMGRMEWEEGEDGVKSAGERNYEMLVHDVPRYALSGGAELDTYALEAGSIGDNIRGAVENLLSAIPKTLSDDQEPSNGRQRLIRLTNRAESIRMDLIELSTFTQQRADLSEKTAFDEFRKGWEEKLSKIESDASLVEEDLKDLNETDFEADFADWKNRIAVLKQACEGAGLKKLGPSLAAAGLDLQNLEEEVSKKRQNLKQAGCFDWAAEASGSFVWKSGIKSLRTWSNDAFKAVPRAPTYQYDLQAALGVVPQSIVSGDWRTPKEISKTARDIVSKSLKAQYIVAYASRLAPSSGNPDAVLRSAVKAAAGTQKPALGALLPEWQQWGDDPKFDPDGIRTVVSDVDQAISDAGELEAGWPELKAQIARLREAKSSYRGAALQHWNNPPTSSPDFEEAKRQLGKISEVNGELSTLMARRDKALQALENPGVTPPDTSWDGGVWQQICSSAVPETELRTYIRQNKRLPDGPLSGSVYWSRMVDACRPELYRRAAELETSELRIAIENLRFKPLCSDAPRGATSETIASARSAITKLSESVEVKVEGWPKVSKGGTLSRASDSVSLLESLLRGDDAWALTLKKSNNDGRSLCVVTAEKFETTEEKTLSNGQDKATKFFVYQAVGGVGGAPPFGPELGEPVDVQGKILGQWDGRAQGSTLGVVFYVEQNRTWVQSKERVSVDFNVVSPLNWTSFENRQLDEIVR
jgi:DNA polymerase III delta prime subunit